jgi:hypothetical protein
MINVVMVILVLAAVCYIMMLIKVNNAYRNCSILLEAVHLYNIDVINSVDYRKEDLIEYEKYLGEGVLTRTLFRLFDWGYTNILPQEVFERIIPYLDDAERIFDQKHAKRK